MADRTFGIETLCLHAGQIPDPATGARAAPIYQTTSFVFDSADHAASLFNLQTFGNVYSRISNPTVAVFEERMAAIENGRAAVAVASGQAAEVVAILTLCAQGDHIVSASTLYGGTHTLLDVNLRKLGIETTFVHPDDPENFRRAITDRTKLVYGETIGNPVGNVIPSAGRAAFNIRFNDLHSSASLSAWAGEIAAREVAGTELTVQLDWKTSGESFVTQPGPRVEAVASAIAAATNRQPQLATGGGTSDARFIKDLCPVMEFGLVGNTMHQVNERVPVAAIRALSRIYLDVLKRFFSEGVLQDM